MNKSVNRLLICGIVLIICGIGLFIYSLITFSEVNRLYDKINFDDLDNNKQVSTSDKYYSYLSNSEYLNKKLSSNKNLPIKNTSCIYLDYAQHNVKSLYKLIYNGDRNDTQRREVVESTVQNLYDMLGFYAGCKQTTEYKLELSKILEDIKKSNELYSNSDVTLDSFLNGGHQIEKREEFNGEKQYLDTDDAGKVIMQDSYSGDSDMEEYAPKPEEKTQAAPYYEISGSYQ